MKRSHKLLLLAQVSIMSQPFLQAEEAPKTPEKADKNSMQNCVIEQFNLSESSRTVGEIQTWCEEYLLSHKKIKAKGITPLEKRIIRERNTADNPNVITPHKRNYLLPVSYMKKANEQPYVGTRYENLLDNWEAKYQLSFKAPIFDDIFTKKDVLFFGFTIQSYWQMYNSDISSPFRETNYQPEIFYGVINDLKVAGWTNRINLIGIEHQSNGQSQPLSRSWNRIYANFIWENEDWVIGLKPWYRLPENKKEDPLQPDGDDNPDIDKYMGNFEFTTTYKWEDQTFSMMMRNNLRSDNKGALQLDWTFPMGSRFKGYLQYFNGYGESLIDYNARTERLGLGVLLTDFF